MDGIESDWENLIRETTRKLAEAEKTVRQCTDKLRDQNRKARFVAQCLGIEE